MTTKTSLLFVVSALALFSASAETLVWTGAAGNSSWQTAGNWEPAQVPTSADDVWLGTATHTTGVYAQPIRLGGNAACNSLNFYQDAAITVGAPGEKLSVASGAVTMSNVSMTKTNEYVIDCDLALEREANVWTMIRGTEFAEPRGRLRVSGKVSAKDGAGTLKLESTNSYRRGRVCFDSTVDCAGPLELAGVFLDLSNTHTAADIFGAEKGLKYSGLGGGIVFVLTADYTFTTPIDMSAVTPSTDQNSNKGVVNLIPFNHTLTVKTPTLTVPEKVELCLGTTSASFVDLQTKITGDGCLAVMRTCAFVHSADDLPSSVRMYGTGGAFLLDGTQMTGEDFVKHFPNGAPYTAGAKGKWGSYNQSDSPGGGLAAHGAPIVIPSAEGSETWFGNQSYLQLGAVLYSDSLARALADAPVWIETETRLTKSLRVQSGNGAYAQPTYCMGPTNRERQSAFTGHLYGPGILCLDGYLHDELWLKGQNEWTGSYTQIGCYGFNPSSGAVVNASISTGAGGMSVRPGVGGTSVVALGSPSALPTGNDGAPAYLLANSRYTARAGYFLNAAPGGAHYDLPTGLKFMLSQGAGAKPDIPFLGAYASADESATLSGDILVNRLKAGATAMVTLMPRGAGEFVLGTAEKPANFIKVVGCDLTNADQGLAGMATPVEDDDGKVAIYVRGDATVVPANVAYTDLSHAADRSADFRWYIGEDCNLDNDHPSGAEGYNGANFMPGTRVYTVYHGAVRTTAAGQPGSILNAPIVGLGGSLELEDCDVELTTSLDPQTAGEIRMKGGLGFAAHGPRDVLVTLNGGATIKCNGAEGFPHANAGLIFGSLTANRTVLFKNDIDCNGQGETRVFLVGGVDADRPVVRLDGAVTNGGLYIQNMERDDLARSALPTGMVELANADTRLTGLSVKSGIALVSCALGGVGHANASFRAIGGELRVTGSLPFMGGHVQAGMQNTPAVGGVLSGTGTIDSHVIIWQGAELRPGLKGEGMLTFNRNLQFFNDSKLTLGAKQPTVEVGGNFYMADRATVKLDGECYGRKKLVTWKGSLGYVDGGSAATSDCSKWTVEGVKDPSEYSIELDTANKCIWLKGRRRGLVLIFR